MSTEIPHSKDELKQVIDYLIERFSHESRDRVPLEFGPSEFEYAEGDSDLKIAAQTSLLENGFVVLNNYMPTNTTDVLADSISQFHSPIALQLLDNKTDKDCGEFIIVGSVDTQYRTFAQLIGAPKPAIRRNTGLADGIDEGFTKIYNADQLFKDHSAVFDEFLRNKFVEEIIRPAVEEDCRYTNVDVFVNESVTNTRGFHVDTDFAAARLFLYLTDVNEPSDGPYTFVYGSHSDPALIPLNQEIGGLLNRNVLDCNFFSEERVKKFVAPRGTLIISMQNGVHRGWPQETGHRRMLAVGHYSR